MIHDLPIFLCEKEDVLSFWSDFKARNHDRINTWLDEQFEFLLLFGSLLLANFFFRALRAAGVHGYIDMMEKLDDGGLLLVVGRFVFDIGLRALSPRGKREASNVRR